MNINPISSPVVVFLGLFSFITLAYSIATESYFLQLIPLSLMSFLFVKIIKRQKINNNLGILTSNTLPIKENITALYVYISLVLLITFFTSFYFGLTKCPGGNSDCTPTSLIYVLSAIICLIIYSTREFFIRDKVINEQVNTEKVNTNSKPLYFFVILILGFVLIINLIMDAGMSGDYSFSLIIIGLIIFFGREFFKKNDIK